MGFKAEIDQLVKAFILPNGPSLCDVDIQNAIIECAQNSKDILQLRRNARSLLDPSVEKYMNTLVCDMKFLHITPFSKLLNPIEDIKSKGEPKNDLQFMSLSFQEYRATKMLDNIYYFVEPLHRSNHSNISDTFEALRSFLTFYYWFPRSKQGVLRQTSESQSLETNFKQNRSKTKTNSWEVFVSGHSFKYLCRLCYRDTAFENQRQFADKNGDLPGNNTLQTHHSKLYCLFHTRSDKPELKLQNNKYFRDFKRAAYYHFYSDAIMTFLRRTAGSFSDFRDVREMAYKIVMEPCQVPKSIRSAYNDWKKSGLHPVVYFKDMDIETLEDLMFQKATYALPR